MAGTELERAERNFAQAKARLRALRNREAVRQRKLETRRRVILGGALIDLEKRDDAAAAMLDRLVRNLSRDQDRTAFEGWALRAEDGPGVEAAGTAGVAGLDVGAGRDAGAGAETRAGMDAGADGGGSAAPAPALSMNRGGLSMGAVLRRLLGGFVTVSWYAVATPVLLGELFFWLIGGFFVFVLVTILALRILTEVIEGASAYWPELLVTVQILVMGFPVTAYVWAERSSLKAYKTHICPEVEARVQDGLARPQTPFENYFVWVRPNIRKSFDANGAVIPVLQQNDGIAMTISARAKAWAPVVPNLLDGDRAMQVMDPMSENARVAAACHMEFGPVHVLDPFGVTGFGNARYNPLDRLDPDSPDLGEDAATLAEALVMDPPGQVQEAHWSEEARALVAGLILFCVAHEGAERRTLATVREYLSLPAEWLRALLELMQDSREAHALIARAANGFLGKADREAASVLSNAQRHTHFLDSSRIADALSQSDFHFADLRYEAATVFLALPPNRMDAYPC